MINWDDVKNKVGGFVVGAVVTGATMLFTVNAKLDTLANAFTEHKAYNNERLADIKENMADFKRQLQTIKNNR